MRTPKQITLVIRTNNDAFEENEGAEISRMLRTTAREYFAGGGPIVCGRWTVRDVNGNTCGTVEIEPNHGGGDE